MIRYESEDIRFSLSDRRLVSQWLNNVAGKASRKIGELNYIFCSDPYLLQINKQYFGKGDRIYGDIYISIDTVRHNAEQYGEGFDRELHRVIAHGLLHLIGYDDVTPELQKEMTAQENASLDLLAKLRNER